MDPLIQGLQRPDAYAHPVTNFQVLETHISWVILTGSFAYKIKKPVNFGFVDFTTLTRRQHFCAEEVRLNRRLAPELYLRVCPIFGEREHATLCGSGDPIEYAVQMRQFDQRDLLPAVLARGELRTEHLNRLADDLAAFHRHAAVVPTHQPWGTPAAVRRPVFDNLKTLAEFGKKPDVIAMLHQWSEQEFARLTPWFEQRRATGRVRECHGDLHLGNMVLLKDTIRAFDCLEFNPNLSWTDVIAELAFVVMDLQDRGRPDLALRLLNQWLEETGDYDGLNGWRWYIVYRALVRAKVAALRVQQTERDELNSAAFETELQTYLALAREWTAARPTAVILMHGLSGSGKSFVSERISDHFAAVRVRSDVERKRLFGQWGDAGPRQLTGDLYSAATTETLYREVLASYVARILDAGFPAVVDATCLHEWQRAVFRDLAIQRGVPFLIVSLETRPEVLRQRIRDRRAASREPSDADEGVLELQLAGYQPLQPEDQVAAVIVKTESTDWWPALAAALQQRAALPPL